jgi:Trafficking protein Mon1.
MPSRDKRALSSCSTYVLKRRVSWDGYVTSFVRSLVSIGLLFGHQLTQPFELYIALSSRLPKSAAVGAANAVARWVKKEEGRLFLRDAPVF